MKLFVSLLSFMFFATFLNVQAQKVPANMDADEEAIVKVVKDFAKEYSTISDSKDQSRVLNFFNAEMKSNLNFIRIGGRVTPTSGNYENFEAHLESLIGAELQIKHEVKEVFNVTVKNNIGVVSYQNNFEVLKGSDVLSKGIQLVTVTQRKFKDGKWRIILYNVTEVEDEKLKGSCLFELFESTDKGVDYVSKVVVPGGTSYNTTLDNFIFRRGEDKELIIKTGVNYFDWDEKDKGALYLYDFTTKERGEKIGSYKDKSEAVTRIVEYLYSDKCTRLVTR